MLEKVKLVVIEEKYTSDDEANVKVFAFTKEPLARECFDMCVNKLKENSYNYEEGGSTFDCFDTGSKVYMWDEFVNLLDFRTELQD